MISHQLSRKDRSPLPHEGDRKPFFPHVAEASLKTPVIAVVNDDSAFLNLMHELLTDEGYDCFIHTVGTTAYETIRNRQPDLVVLDVRMSDPESGWHVLDMMRLDPETRAIPVIICSADTQQLRDKEPRLKEQNAVALEKPFNLEELIQHVSKFVGPAAPE